MASQIFKKFRFLFNLIYLSVFELMLRSKQVLSFSVLDEFDQTHSSFTEMCNWLEFDKVFFYPSMLCSVRFSDYLTGREPLSAFSH